MTRLFFIILILLMPRLAVAQSDTAEIKQAMTRLDQALLDRDSVSLVALLHPQLSYGHSNGWIQEYREVGGDGATGKLKYHVIRPETVPTFSVAPGTITTRQQLYVEGAVNDKSFALHLHVLQVWVKTKNGWQLLARQSVKTANNELTK